MPWGTCFRLLKSSIDPAATPAALIEVVPWRTLYAKSAVLAGNRNPYKQDPNGLHFAIRDTPVFVNEIGFTHDTEDLSEQRTQFDRKRYPGTYNFGAAYNGGNFADAAGTVRSGDYLIYGMANQAVSLGNVLKQGARRDLSV